MKEGDLTRVVEVEVELFLLEGAAKFLMVKQLGQPGVELQEEEQGRTGRTRKRHKRLN